MLGMLPDLTDFFAALAYELSLALRFTEGDLDLDSAGEMSRMLL